VFENGERVMCVKNAPWFDYDTGDEIPGPRRGHICTVRGVDRHPVYGVGISLCEWGTGMRRMRLWDPKSFVPLKKTQTDISVFTTLLNKVPPGRPVRMPVYVYVDLSRRIDETSPIPWRDFMIRSTD
jgi:hypothetical protein